MPNRRQSNRGNALLRLRQLSAAVDAAMIQLEAAPRRDPKTGTFTARGSFDGKTLRNSWRGTPAASGPNPRRDAFKKSLLTALRSPRR